MLHVEIYSLISEVMFGKNRHYFALRRHPSMPRTWCDECIFSFRTLRSMECFGDPRSLDRDHCEHPLISELSVCRFSPLIPLCCWPYCCKGCLSRGLYPKICRTSQTRDSYTEIRRPRRSCPGSHSARSGSSAC